MSLFTSLLQEYANPTSRDGEWLHRLVGDWQLVADLAFSDLVLWLPVGNDGYLALDQVRPSTTHTVFHHDLMGQSLPEELEPLVEMVRRTRAMDSQVIAEGTVRVDAVPIFRLNRYIALITCHTDTARARGASRLEKVYRQSAVDLLRMNSLGLWPDFTSPSGSRGGAPRVGDGLIRLDADGVVEYASPNGVSAFRRLSEVETLEGSSLAELVADLSHDRRAVDETLPLVATGKMPWRAEVESYGMTLSLRSIPLRDATERFGALVLCRDVTELRRRELELLSKDATIREIHHRVKNNLQTVSALLRMQSRRMTTEEGRRGLAEAMRRVSTIALVHETLSEGLDQNVNFDEVIGRQFRLAAEVADPGQSSSDGRGVRTERDGDFGDIPSELAPPLALVINELVSNAVEHGLKETGGVVRLKVRRDAGPEGEKLRMVISDDGVGWQGNDVAEGLGMQIVRTLVTSELKGTIGWAAGAEGGTEVTVDVPLFR